MSASNVYLVPVNEPKKNIQEIKIEVIEYFQKMGIIGELYPDCEQYDEEWYCAGNNVSDLFNDREKYPFEYAKIYSSNVSKLIPEIYSWGARCINCDNELDEIIQELSENKLDNDEYNNWDMAEEAICCPNCEKKIFMKDLRFDDKSRFAKFWIEFDDINTIDFNEKIFNDLEKIVGEKLIIITERM
jgi:DNA-directed RNA polymerase subunit RPC12/RpoP